jgi:hypothetical protein
VAPDASERRRGTAAELLSVADLTLDVRVHGATVAVVGTDARPGRLARVTPVEVRAGGALLALVREVRSGWRAVRRLMSG